MKAYLINNITGRKMMAAIDNLSGQKTIIMVAHRLARQNDTFHEMAHNV